MNFMIYREKANFVHNRASTGPMRCMQFIIYLPLLKAMGGSSNNMYW